MTAFETDASLEADQAARQAADEGDASDAAFERSLGIHTVSVTRVRRVVHDIARHIWRVRCRSCGFAREFADADVVRARREASKHETSGAAL